MTERPDYISFMESLGGILEQYSEWYGYMMRTLFYSGELGSIDHRPQPEHFDDWIKTAEEHAMLDNTLIDTLKNIHKELGQMAEKFYRIAGNSGIPSLDDFDHFRHVYEDFYVRVRRMEKDSQLADGGIDRETGFRSMSAFDRDLAREMERRSRSETPFCLAVCIIDDFEKIQGAGDHAMAQAVKGAAEGIMDSLRTFDDPYRKDKGEFILCLKNTDISGANSAATRINNYLRKNSIAYTAGDQKNPVTISCTIAEVLPEEDLEELIENMTRDIKKSANEAGTILQFKEMSELQRYVQNIGD